MKHFIRKVVSPLTITAFLLTVLGLAPFLMEPKEVSGETDETTYYFLTDHLGSVDTVLDDQGNVVERRDYLPYGQERLVHEELNSPETNYGFTGKELDSETGLNYFGARYYDSVTGRFIQMDPMLMGLDKMSQEQRNAFLSNPQNLNYYAYVQNNPVRYTDPTGMYGEDVHYDLTLYLGMISGIGYENAKTIAYRNQHMDVNPSTNPKWSHWVKEPEPVGRYHFQTRENALSNLELAIEYGSLTEVGDAMHTFQDTYSHKGLAPLEHAELGHTPDYTYSTSANIAKANRMARVSFFQFRKLNLKINGTGGLTKDDYLTQSTEIWNRYQGEINDYLSKENKEGTKIEVLANIAKETEVDE